MATADEARQITQPGVWYDSVKDTLFHAGLPPSRTDGQKGFMTYETDGKIKDAQAAPTNAVHIL